MLASHCAELRVKQRSKFHCRGYPWNSRKMHSMKARSHSLEFAPVAGMEGKGYSKKMVRMDRKLPSPVLLEVAAHEYQGFCR